MSNGKGLRDSASILIGQNKQTITAIVDSIEKLENRQRWLVLRVREIASSIPDSAERNKGEATNDANDTSANNDGSVHVLDTPVPSISHAPMATSNTPPPQHQIHFFPAMLTELPIINTWGPDRHRIDLPLNPDQDIVDEISGFTGANKLCRFFHLTGKCNAGTECTYRHEPALPLGVEEALRFLTRTITKCHNGVWCNKPECFYGHKCPLRGEGCDGVGCAGEVGR